MNGRCETCTQPPTGQTVIARVDDKVTLTISVTRDNADGSKWWCWHMSDWEAQKLAAMLIYVAGVAVD